MQLTRYVLLNSSGNTTPGFFRTLSGLGLASDKLPMSLFSELPEPKDVYENHHDLEAWFTEEGIEKFSEGIAAIRKLHEREGHIVCVETIKLDEVSPEYIVYRDAYQILLLPEH